MEGQLYMITTHEDTVAEGMFYNSVNAIADLHIEHLCADGICLDDSSLSFSLSYVWDETNF